jgi:hypothetical protein
VKRQVVRSWRSMIVIFGLLVSIVQQGAISASAATSQATYATQAESTYKSMQSVFCGVGNNLCRESTASSGNPYAYLWPISMAAAGTVDLPLVSSIFAKKYGAGTADKMAGLNRYYDPQPLAGLPGFASYVTPPLGGGGDKYLDDQSWVAWDMIRAYVATGNALYLQRAQSAFALIADGWDTTSACGNVGGVYWKQQRAGETNHDRNTVSTASGAIVAARLYQLTGSAVYLQWAESMVAWVDTYLRDSSDGLYWDHFRNDCSLDAAKWSYNQGSMALAKQLLLESGSLAGVSADSAQIVQSSLNYYAGQFETQDRAFNAIFFRAALYVSRTNVALLASVTTAAQGYADRQWSSPSHRSGVWYQADNRAYLIDTGSMLQIYAMLATSPTVYTKLV